MSTMAVLYMMFTVGLFTVNVDTQGMTYTFRTNNPDFFQTLQGLLRNSGAQMIGDPSFNTGGRRFVFRNPSVISNTNIFQTPVMTWQTIRSRQQRQQRRQPQITQIRRQQPSFNNQQRFIPQQQPVVQSQGLGQSHSHGLTAYFKRHILDSHNNYRAELGASDMYALKWNDQLADESLDWAKQCHWGHQKAGRGENLAMISGSGLSLDSLIDYGLNGWYNEKHQYDGQDCMSTGSCHYTQMIWSTTREVGCAAHMCPDMYYLVCFYSPPGNIMGVSPYQSGTPCSACSGICKNNLCHW